MCATPSFLLQAQQSKAKIIGLANAGSDIVNAIKQGSEFGIMAGGQRFAGLLVTLVDVNTLGLKAAQGLVLTEGWYWDMNDANREWTRRWQVMRPGKFPTMSQAGIYPSVLHYLKVVAALKSDADGRAVVAKMKEMPTDDPLFDKGYIRADGRKVHPASSRSRSPKNRSIQAMIIICLPGAFRPMKDGQCPMVHG